MVAPNTGVVSSRPSTTSFGAALAFLLGVVSFLGDSGAGSLGLSSGAEGTKFSGSFCAGSLRTGFASAAAGSFAFCAFSLQFLKLCNILL